MVRCVLSQLKPRSSTFLAVALSTAKNVVLLGLHPIRKLEGGRMTPGYISFFQIRSACIIRAHYVFTIKNSRRQFLSNRASANRLRSEWSELIFQAHSNNVQCHFQYTPFYYAD